MIVRLRCASTTSPKVRPPEQLPPETRRRTQLYPKTPQLTGPARTGGLARLAAAGPSDTAFGKERRDAADQRPETPSLELLAAAPRLSDSNTSRWGRGERPPNFVRRVSARLQDRDSESEPREPRPNRRTVHWKRPGAELNLERPSALATASGRHLRRFTSPGGGSLTARISCVAGEPGPTRPTTRW